MSGARGTHTATAGLITTCIPPIGRLDRTRPARPLDTHDPDHAGIRPPGYRLPSAARLGRVRLQVASLDRSLDFYHGVIGFRIAELRPSLALLGAPDNDEPLIELHEHPGAHTIPPHGRLGLYHFAVLLPTRAALGRLAEHLARTGTRAGMADHIVSEALYLNDPDGLGIEIYADRPRDQWRRNGRELVMASDPLYVTDLIRAGADERWSGIPTGTTIGHVHLHVGDLDTATAFYHSALGLDVMVWSYPGALFLAAGGYHHHLGINTWAARAPRPASDDARLLDWEILLPTATDVAAAAQSVIGCGYDVAHHDDDSWTSVDPWGTHLRVAMARDRPAGRSST